MRLRRHATDRERGAVIVEAALITPIFFLIMLGFLEYANAFRMSMTVRNAAHDTAREISASSGFYDADFAGLTVAKKTLARMNVDVTKVIVFKATGPNDTVPSSCKALTVSGPYTGVNGLCTVYSGSLVTGLVDADRAQFGYVPSGPARYDQNYPALGRQESRSLASEWVGVYVEANYRKLTRVVWTPAVMTATNIIPIEPRTA